MSDFDVQQVREAAARVIVRAEFPSDLGGLLDKDRKAADAALAVIVPAVTAQIRTLHAKRAWHTPQLAGYECSTCRQPFPCPTVRLCDQLDASVRGEGHG